MGLYVFPICGSKAKQQHLMVWEVEEKGKLGLRACPWLLLGSGREEQREPESQCGATGPEELSATS